MSQTFSGVSARSLVVTRGGHRVLRGLDLDASPGSVLGLIGPNGAGKTTLLAALAGILTIDSGSITVAGVPLDNLSARRHSRMVSLMPQDTSITFDTTVRSLVEVGRHPHRRRFTALDPARDRLLVDDALDRTGLTSLAEHSVLTLSGGQRQLAHVARTIAQDTPVVLMDEPVSALDLAHQIRIFDVIHEISRSGRTVVLVLHDLTQASRYCDELLLLNNGEVHSHGTPQDVLTPHHLASVYGVNTAVDLDPHTSRPRVHAHGLINATGRGCT